MKPELKYKIQRCGQLLSQSPLDEEVKKTIVDNFVSLSEKDIDKLLESLERETLELTSLAKEFGEFDKKQKKEWDDLAKNQERVTNEIYQEILKQNDIK